MICCDYFMADHKYVDGVIALWDKFENLDYMHRVFDVK